MRIYSGVIIGTAGLALLGVVGCSGGATGGEEPAPSAEPGSALKKLDTCSVFQPQDLTAAGVSGPGQPETQLEYEPGCVFEGEALDLTLYKNQSQTVDSYETDGSWEKYERFEINGRKAARAVEPGGSDQGCSIVINAGGGVVLVDVTSAMPGSLPDPCSEAEKTATRIEPRLPK